MGIYEERSRDWEGSPPYHMYPPPFGNVLVASKKLNEKEDKEKIQVNKIKETKKM